MWRSLHNVIEVFEHMKEIPLDRNPTNVKTVEWPTGIIASYKDTEGLI